MSSDVGTQADGLLEHGFNVQRKCADAATFAKARTIFRHASQKPTADPSQRQLRAQVRAQREERKAAGEQEADDEPGEADANELEAAALLVDLMAHEALPETGNMLVIAITSIAITGAQQLASCCTDKPFQHRT